ncbi:unnamed protein product, partial [Meganyctiphanes norvegica]
MSIAGITRIISGNSSDVYRYDFHSSYDVEHKSVHLDDKPYQCSNCGKVFVQNGDLLKHQRMHMEEKSYQCNSVEQKQKLTPQNIIGQVPYQCSNCDNYFSCQSSLNLHLRTHTGEKPFQCSNCEKCFVFKCALEKHEIMHLVERPYQCSNCDECFAIESSLVQHQKIHNEDSHFHHQILHNEDNPFHYSHCERDVIEKGTIKEHQRINMGNRSYQCSNCDKYFSRRSALVQHQRIHTKENPYKYGSCKKIYTPKDHIKKSQSVNTVIPQKTKSNSSIICQICKTAIIHLSANHLITHLKCHTDFLTFRSKKYHITIKNALKDTYENHWFTYSPWPVDLLSEYKMEIKSSRENIQDDEKEIFIQND